MWKSGELHMNFDRAPDKKKFKRKILQIKFDTENTSNQ